MKSRWKYWYFYHYENSGFTFLCPLFALELVLHWVPEPTVKCYWRGWRFLWWPYFDSPDQYSMLLFKRVYERVERMTQRSIYESTLRSTT